MGRLQDRRKWGKPCMACANKRRATHGLSGHPLYRLLKGMEARCKNQSHEHYRYYGGKGIRVCEQWEQDPEAFAAWALANGYAKGLEIDRIDPDGDYCPENCRFVSHEVNSQNRTNGRCDKARAAIVHRELAAGASVRDAANSAGVPYMSAWHIAKGNTWRNAA